MHPVRETLPDSTRVYRVNIASEFLKAGIPLSKIDNLRGLLEAGEFSLSHSTHLHQLIQFILDQELDNLKYSISGKLISKIFDRDQTSMTLSCRNIFLSFFFWLTQWKCRAGLGGGGGGGGGHLARPVLLPLINLQFKG